MKTIKTGFWMAIVALLSMVAIPACSDENVEMVGECPEVIATSPSDGAVGIPLDQIVTVTFNEPMDPATIQPDAFSLEGTAPAGARVAEEVEGVMSYNAQDYTLTFQPVAPLNPDFIYTGTVGTQVKNLTGSALQVDYVWSFETGDSVSPIVLSTDPEDGEEQVFLNKTISATFNMPMGSSLSSTSFVVSQGDATLDGNVTTDGSTVSFDPADDLQDGLVYTASITTEAASASGTFLAEAYEWSFSTGTLIAPTVLETTPADGASNVELTQVITIEFSEAMNPSTIDNLSFMVMIGETAILGNVNYSGTTATFTPNGGLESGNSYSATITMDAENTAGISLIGEYSWDFTTNDPLGPGFVDLKTVGEFGIIAGVGVSNEAGFSEIRNLNVGISPGVRSSIVGFPPAIIVNGEMYASDDTAPEGVADMLIEAKQDLVDAYLFAESATTPAPVTVAGDQGGLTLAPGIYKSTSTLLIESGDLTLNAQGDAKAVWIFQIASDFTTIGGAGGNVILAGGAQAKNVFWQTGSSATIGDNTNFKGNILALTSITMNSGATAQGRMLARNGSVVMISTNIIERP